MKKLLPTTFRLGSRPKSVVLTPLSTFPAMTRPIPVSAFIYGFLRLIRVQNLLIVVLTQYLARLFLVGPLVGAVIAFYVIANAIYTMLLKRVAVFDVFCLAGLYTLRIVAGAAAVAVPLSTWLVAFSVFAFLSLALLKRAADIDRLAPDEVLPGRGYSGKDAAFVNGFGISTAIAACLVLALYVASEQVVAMYGDPL